MQVNGFILYFTCLLLWIPNISNARSTCSSNADCVNMDACVLGTDTPTLYGWSNSQIACATWVNQYEDTTNYCIRASKWLPYGWAYCENLGCLVGTFAATGVCSVCPQGHECQGGMTNPNACTGGYFCVSNTKTQCPIGFFCPTASSSPTKCPANHYCDQLGAIAATPCPQGTVSPQSSSSPTACCPIGTNCTIGSTTLCLSGYWESSGTCKPCTQCTAGYLMTDGCNATKNIACSLCEAGSYCPTVSTSVSCPSLFFCPNGSTAPIRCQNDKISPINSTNINNCTCKEDMYESSATNCTRCAAGYYKGSLDSVCVPCSSAHITGPFQWTLRCDYQCAEGYYLIKNNTCVQFLQFDRPPPGGYQLVPIAMQQAATIGFVDRLKSNRIYAHFTANNVIRFQHVINNATILAVGGGGAGATFQFGGGGAGAVVMVQEMTLTHTKTYTVEVGAGGRGDFGKPSRVSSENTTLVLAMGGGAGNSGNGGCGGGNYKSYIEGSISRPIGKALSANVPTGIYGFDGGASQSFTYIHGGLGSSGGGGAGGPGGIPSPITNVGGDGGAAIVVNLTGTPIVFAGGGGGSTQGLAPGTSKGGGAMVNGQMVYVGGGAGGGINGVPGTGSGGATGNTAGGDGGTGAVIILWDAAFIACEKNTYSPVGATACTQCMDGMISPTGAARCTCPPGEYYNTSASRCVQCSEQKNCTSDQITRVCGLEEDGGCTECTDGSYKSSPTTCTKCNTTECAPGTYRTKCGGVLDAVCAPCPIAPNTEPFNWTSMCNLVCIDSRHRLVNGSCSKIFLFSRPPPAGYGQAPLNITTGGTVGFVDKQNSNRMFARFTASGSVSFMFDINVSVLAVGGGGAGAKLSYGGGGAGAVVVVKNIALKHGKKYSINVGAGGVGALSTIGMYGTNTAQAAFGGNSEFISDDTPVVLALGGGAGGSGNGGCGGGNNPITIDYLVLAPIGRALSTNIPAGMFGFDGGLSIAGLPASSGGGGAGGPGESPTSGFGGNGGAAVVSNITGIPTVLAGGGAGTKAVRGMGNGGGSVVNGQTIIVGGGISGKHGIPGTGSGGATSERGDGTVAGDGGSGLIVVSWEPIFTLCQNGTYSNSDTSSCTQCMDGMISPAGAASCTCYPGEFRNTSINQCIKCSKQKCQPGHRTKICSFEEDLTCIRCKNGTFNVDGSMDACLPCPGNSKSSDGSSICSCDLEMGYYMHNTTLNACMPCPQNHRCQSPNTAAIPCSPGFQRPYEQLPIDACTPCTNLPVVGNYTWNADVTCDPQCTEGFYTLDSGEDRFCLSCFQNYTGGSPTCALGMYMPICEKGSVRKKSCAYCPTPLPAGAVWAGICDFVCDDGLYYNSTTALCTPCSQPQCVPGESVVACAKDTDTLCAQCLDGPLNGPFEWTTGCNFSCLNATFYDESNNRTCSTPEPTTTPQSTTDRPTPQSTADSPKSTAPTVKSSPIFRTSSPLITTQQDSTPMLKTTRITLAMPTSTSASKPITSTPSSSTSVRPTTTIPDTTPAITVFVQTKTEMKLNNTVQQVCANLDSLVSVVVGAMRDTFGVPFTGNISTINNQTVDTACTNTTTIRRRFLLVTPPSTNQNVTISTRALEPILEERATATILATNTTNNIIQARLGNQTTLQATSVDTSVKSTATGTPQPTPESIQAIPVLIYVGIAIGVSVLFGLICTMVFCYIRTFYPNRNTTGYRVIPVKIEADMM